MTVWTVAAGVLFALVARDFILAGVRYIEEKKAERYFDELMANLEDELEQIRKKPAKKAAAKKK